MTLASANTVAALVRRTASGRDEFGNHSTFTEAITTMPAIYAPGASVETADGGDTVVTQPTVYLPTGADVSAIDAVIPHVIVDGSGDPVLDGDGRAQGDRYEVDGQPNAWPPNPFSGWQPPFSIEVHLKRVTG